MKNLHFNTLIGCESSGQVREAMNAYRGLYACSCDLLPADDGKHDYHKQGDVLPVIKSRHWLFVGNHYTCTFFTNSGVRWMWEGGSSDSGVLDFKRLEKLNIAADEFAAQWLAIREHAMHGYFENPVMHHYAADALLQRIPGWHAKPSQIIQPWMFGAWETKATGLWLHNLPPLVPRYRTVEACRIALGLPVGSKPAARVHRASPGPDRWKERSRTLPEIAAAMAEQWAPYILKT